MQCRVYDREHLDTKVLELPCLERNGSEDEME